MIIHIEGKVLKVLKFYIRNTFYFLLCEILSFLSNLESLEDLESTASLKGGIYCDLKTIVEIDFIDVETHCVPGV